MRNTTTLAGAVVLLSLASGSAFSQAIYRLTELERPAFRFATGTDINDSGQVTGYGIRKPDFLVHPRKHSAFLWSGERMRDLGSLGGGHSLGLAINASGQVTGATLTGGRAEQHAFLWDRGIMQDLGTLGGPSSGGAAINDAGQVAGTSSTNPGTSLLPWHAFLWDGATMRDLGTLGGLLSEAIAMNALGQVTGVAEAPPRLRRAFLFDGNSMKDLGTFGGSESVGRAINDSGWVTGSARTTNDANSHAFLWDGRSLRDLGTLGGLDSEGVAINAAGQVAGEAETSAGEFHAFLWDGSSMHDLGPPGGGSFSTDINAAGQVTGSAFVPRDKISHAFLWDSGTLHDLNDLIDPADPLKSHVEVEVGLAINDAGYIVGSGIDRRKPREAPAYLLSPAAPDDLSAKNVMTGGDRFVRLAWSDLFADETRFLIERSPVSNQRCGAFTTIGSRTENVTVFRDTTISPNTNYCYQLRVIRPTVVHTLSNVARIRTNQ